MIEVIFAHAYALSCAEALKEKLGKVKLKAITRERVIQFGKDRAKEGAGAVTISMDIGYLKLVVSHAAAVHGIAEFLRSVHRGTREGLNLSYCSVGAFHFQGVRSRSSCVRRVQGAAADDRTDGGSSSAMVFILPYRALRIVRPKDKMSKRAKPASPAGSHRRNNWRAAREP